MDINNFDIENLYNYLENTPEDSWCVDVVKTKDNKNCLFGHIWDWGGGKDGNSQMGTQAMDIFEARYATTYMVYPINDGKNKQYQHPTPKQRCLAYIRDLINGTAKTTIQLMNEYEAS